LFGYSRQAYYKQKSSFSVQVSHQEKVISLVRNKRMRMPRLGTRKLYHLLKKDFESQGLKVGRDQLFRILRVNHMLVKPRKCYHKTTNSKHWLRKHKNLVQDMIINRPEQVWVADITYIPTQQGHNYLSLITDAFSRQIMGYHLAEDLKTDGPLKALKMAIKNRLFNESIIHHSDRGLQYCSYEYQKLLANNQLMPSMTESYDPYQNAIAERVNGILKDEFNLEKGFKEHLEALQVIKESIEIYNTERPHFSCQLKTPAYTHKKNAPSYCNSEH
jgi:transposase InsO family protein